MGDTRAHSEGLNGGPDLTPAGSGVRLPLDNRLCKERQGTGPPAMIREVPWRTSQ